MQETVELAKLILNWDLYPRGDIDRTQVRRMVAALQAGEQFPPILVDKRTHMVVDGFHRVTVHKQAKLDEIAVVYKAYRGEAEMLLDSVRLNARHGVPLEPMDHVRVGLLARDRGIADEQIAEALAVPVEYLAKMMAQRIATGPDGLPVILKRTIGGTHAGRRLTRVQVAVNDRLIGMRATYYLGRVLDLVRHRLLDLSDPRVVDLLGELRGELDALDRKGVFKQELAAA